MSTTFQRSPATLWLRSQIETDVGFPCGDGIIPEGSGWGTQQPNLPTSKFTPWLVLTTMTARPIAMAGSLAPGAAQEDWNIPYVIQSIGQSRTQAETVADAARAAISALRGTILDLHTNFVEAPNNFKIAEVWWDSIGGINVTSQTDPPFYGEQDQFTLELKKRLT
jgi:hypothetical protein